MAKTPDRFGARLSASKADSFAVRYSAPEKRIFRQHQDLYAQLRGVIHHVEHICDGGFAVTCICIAATLVTDFDGISGLSATPQTGGLSYGSAMMP